MTALEIQQYLIQRLVRKFRLELLSLCFRGANEKEYYKYMPDISIQSI